MPRIFYDHKLHAVAKPEVRNLLLAGKLYRFNLPFDTTLPETTRDNDAVIRRELCNSFRTSLLKIFRIQPGNLGSPAKLRCREFNRFDD